MEQALECDVAGHVTHVFIQMYRSIEKKVILDWAQNIIAGTMGVSTTGESGETFPTRSLTLESYWAISPVKNNSGLTLTLSS